MTLLLAAVMYSPNIGDGVIAECIRAAAPADIEFLDLAGRTGYAEAEAPLRRRLLAGLSRLPAPLADRIAEQLVTAQIRRRLDPLLPQALARTDALLIGGGQLLADANLNFPLKLHRLICAADDRPIGLHAVGVAAGWSPRAAALFRDLLSHSNLRFLSVRDAASKHNLEAHLAALGLNHLDPPLVFPDPGVLCAPLLGDGPRAPVAPPARHIGLGVTHPTALRLHGGAAGGGHWPAWYARLARRAVARGLTVTLFTNGAFEDEACLDETIRHLADIDPHALRRAPRPDRPAALLHLISGLDAVISHRLHASIVAYSAGVPPIGLPWDRKLEGFFDLIGRPDALLRQPQPEPDEILARLGAPPLDPEHHAAVLDEARRGITKAVHALHP
ncbi:polysaccharide pyruvyl transferase family protein [Roseobacter sinensis]|uniref:Polysaccharide pyruvyl transferase family protein n=1 Tax=Roseobacter sinensis TaxID=2931391 RepID=A0ABT3BK54_9RHOB|nr:polysaccharide pyruvyl transferase family protein [Roseobacter sp. WL0113]MCV3273955.1 polysaccharide pyruvyl transferase family protein [Roseobacter sp. WL0113]